MSSYKTEHDDHSHIILFDDHITYSVVKHFVVTQGKSFATKIAKQESQLTADMIQRYFSIPYSCVILIVLSYTIYCDTCIKFV